jgi:hypothetical protein
METKLSINQPIVCEDPNENSQNASLDGILYFTGNGQGSFEL